MARTTQSFRMYQLFSKKRAGQKHITRDAIVKALNLKPEYVGSYIAEFKRVYGAEVVYNAKKTRYELKNKIRVPRAGLAGKQQNALVVAAAVEATV